MPDGMPTAADPGPGPVPQAWRDPDEERFELERMLMDADRMMMQMVSLSLSLIGFGFSIVVFFGDVARFINVAGADRTARNLGLALLILGLLFLSTGAWTQARYRRELLDRFSAVCDSQMRRAMLDGRATPTYMTAVLLLVIGLAALASILLRKFL